MFDVTRILLKFVSLVLGISQSQNFPPPLSAEEERELFLKMQGGSKSARAKIIEHNMRLVSHIIRKYYSSYGYQDELISIGSFGLIKAVDSFKSDVGTRFATYAARCVQNEILMYFRAQKKCGCEVSINETIDIDKDGNPLTYLDVISTDDT
ncbi:MAG: sigma-70 family RNA polymerase sigma factor, partial [Clostridia bacterium]|nr:sigma-70 family RNA polymerase sigma factor [Clostridia bacterium]